MKKKIWLSILSLGILASALFVLLKSPLEIGTLASNHDATLVVVGVGNKGVGNIQITGTVVNHDENPLSSQIQHSHALLGFPLSNDLRQEENQQFNFKDLKDVTIQIGTSPSIQFKKLDQNTATEQDESYGVTIVHNKPIHRVQLKYTYFGIPFTKEISTDNLVTL